MGEFRKKPVVIEAFKLTYEAAMGKERVPEWAVEATNTGVIKVNVTEKLHGSQFAEIKTLEGTMTANANDWIIKGIKGEFYPCKPDIFEATYETVSDKSDKDFSELLLVGKGTFGQALEALKHGKLVQRQGWNGKGMFIVKQVPAVISLEIIPKMQSLPQAAKKELLNRNTPISYENQMLIIHPSGRADSWVPSSSDCFAEDWQILE